MNRTLIRDALQTAKIGGDVTLAGWVRTVRTSKGGFSFITLNDGSCLAAIQIVADKMLGKPDSEVVGPPDGYLVVATRRLVEG